MLTTRLTTIMSGFQKTLNQLAVLIKANETKVEADTIRKNLSKLIGE